MHAYKHHVYVCGGVKTLADRILNVCIHSIQLITTVTLEIEEIVLISEKSGNLMHKYKQQLSFFL